MKILFVTNRNVINTCGELRLIKNRAVSLNSTYKIKTDFLVYRNDTCKEKKQEEIGEFSSMQQFLFNKKNLFSMQKQFGLLKKETIEKLKTLNYKVVVLSGNLVLKLAKIIRRKFPMVKIIMDVHGAIEELVEFQGKGLAQKCFKRVAYLYLKKQEKKYIRYADAYFVVSKALKEYLIKEYGIKNKEFFVVPCAQGKSALDIVEKQNNREKYRSKYGIDENQKLFVYSGGLSPWQCIEETVDLFKKITKEVENCKLLLLSGNKSTLEKYSAEDIIVDSLPYSLVNETICAGDYAFMLRQDFITNNVAYPNKFIEYVASGMKVIATPFVNDVAEQIRQYEIGVIINEFSDKELIEYVKKPTCYMDDIINRRDLLDEVCFENRLKKASEFIIGKEK